MILTCPNCATRYLVDDSEIRAEGRKVRCSACGDEWRVMPEHPAPEPAAGEEIDEPPAAEASGPDAAPAEADEARPEPAEGLIVAPIHTQSRAAPAPRSSLAANLALIIIVAAALVVAAYSFRAEIMRLVPASRGIYAAFGVAAAPSAAVAVPAPAPSQSAPDPGTHD